MNCIFQTILELAWRNYKSILYITFFSTNHCWFDRTEICVSACSNFILIYSFKVRWHWSLLVIPLVYYTPIFRYDDANLDISHIIQSLLMENRIAQAESGLFILGTFNFLRRGE